MRAYAKRVRWPVLGCVPPTVALVRKRRTLGMPRPVSLALAAMAPVAVASALPRGRFRAAAVWAAPMWAYKAGVGLAHDHPGRARAGRRVATPRRADGVRTGEPPPAWLRGVRGRPPRLSWLDRAASFVYFAWEVEPHA